MKGEVLYQKVVVTDSVDEINSILADGSFRIQSITPIPFSSELKFDGANASGGLKGGYMCYLLAKVDGFEYKPKE